MRNVSKHSKGILLACFLIVVISAIAWQTDDKNKKDKSTYKYEQRDTTVPKRYDYDSNEFRMKDLDLSMKDLDNSLKELNLNLKDLHINISETIKDALADIDFDQITKDIDIEIKKVDVEKIKREVEKELKEIDVEKIKLEIDKELKNVDFEKINKEVQESLKEAQQQLKQIDKQKLQKEMKELQLKLNNSEFKDELDNALKNAQKEIDKAKQELRDLKDFTTALEKDGLVDRKNGYTIEWTKDGDLIINGKTQPKEISDKYSRYYKKDGYKIKIRPDDDLETDNL